MNILFVFRLNRQCSLYIVYLWVIFLLFLWILKITDERTCKFNTHSSGAVSREASGVESHEFKYVTVCERHIVASSSSPFIVIRVFFELNFFFMNFLSRFLFFFWKKNMFHFSYRLIWGIKIEKKKKSMYIHCVSFAMCVFFRWRIINNRNREWKSILI